MSARRFFLNHELDDSSYDNPGDLDPCEREDANLVSSLCEDGLHRPILDLDIRAELVPSSTAGHGHLYIDVPMSFDTMIALIDALASAGVVERGWATAVRKRGMALVRPPWVKKPAEPKQLPEAT